MSASAETGPDSFDAFMEEAHAGGALKPAMPTGLDRRRTVLSPSPKPAQMIDQSGLLSVPPDDWTDADIRAAYQLLARLRSDVSQTTQT